MKAALSILIIIAFPLFSYTQGESDWWYFGNHAGIHFQNGQAIADTNSAMYSFISCATISDPSGKLLFYSNGDKVWSKNHKLMENGDSISNVNYLSNPARISYVSLIINSPSNKDQYYLFTTDDHYNGTTYLYLSIIDLSFNNGIGKVVSKRNILLTDVCCKLTAVQHTDKKSIWIITHSWNSSLFYSFLITKSGISKTVISNIGNYIGGANKSTKLGYLRVSPRGDKIAAATSCITQPSCGTTLEIFDFNQKTGELSNPLNLNIVGPAGVEFSSDGSKLYFTSENNKINQIDLSLKTTNEIINSQQIVGSIGFFYGLQLAKDGKIYVTRQYSEYLGVINNPNEKGTACNYNDSGLYLGGKQSTRGLPIFIQSYFFKPDFEAIGTCLGNSTLFYLSDTSRIDSVAWDFGDIASGAANYSRFWRPKHPFSDTGIYKVQVFLYHSAGKDTFSREIRISPYPKADFSINDFEQCFNNNYFEFTNTRQISSGACSYEWHFGDGNLSYDTNSTHSYQREDSFMVSMIALSDYGCTDTVSKKVYVFPPKADFTVSDTALCFTNNQFRFSNQSRNDYGTIDYVWYFVDGDSSLQRDTVIHSFLHAGSYEVELIAQSNFGCADTMTKVIVVFPMPEADFIINDLMQCQKANNFLFTDQTSIQSGSFTNKWYFGDGDSSEQKHPTHSYKNKGNHGIRLLITSDFGCKDSLSKQITIHPSPQAFFTINDSIQCENEQYFLFTDSSTITGDSIAENIWILGADTIRNQHPPWADQIRNNLKHGTWNMELIVTTKNGCQDTAVRQITVHPSPTALFTINDSVQCENEQLFEFANNSSVTGDSISDLLWIIGTDSIRNQHPPWADVIRNDLEHGTWNMELIVTTTNLCSDTALRQITVHPSPKADFSINDTAQCENQQLFEFTNTSTVTGDSISDLLWIIGSDTINNLISTIQNNLKPGIWNMELIVTTANSCSDTALRQITVFPSPKADFSINDTAQCENQQLFKFTNTSTVAGDSISNLLWILGADSIRNQQSPIRNNLEHGTWNMELIVTTTNLCSDTALHKIIVFTSPKADFSINDTAQCENQQLFEFTNTSTITGDSISNLLWILGTDTFSHSHILTFSHFLPGTWNMELMVSTTNLCSDTTLKQITVFPAPVASFSLNDSTQCLNDNRFYLINGSTIANGTMSYVWTFGDSSGPVTITHPLKKFANWGKYELQLIVSSDHNCTDTLRKSTYVFPMPLAAFIYLNNCLEDTMYFYDKSSIDSGNIAQWLWDFKNGNQSTLQNPWQIYSDSGQKDVTLVSTSDFGCSSDTTRYFFIEAHVTEPVLERATIENNETVLVEWLPPRLGNPMTYHLEKSTDGNNWQHIKDENRNTFSYLDPQARFSERPYYYRINVTDSCEYTGDYSNIGKSIHLTADTTDLFPVLTWTPYEYWESEVERYELQVKGWGDFQTLIEIPYSAFPNPTSAISQVDSFFTITGKDYCYRVIAYRTGDSLQSVSNEVCIPTAFRLFVPNAFTPNNDGINDVFMPAGIYIKEYQMQIYSRWGEKLFESDDIRQGWDGTFKDECCPAGVYYYQMIVKTAEGKNKTVSGSVHLLK